MTTDTSNQSPVWFMKPASVVQSSITGVYAALLALRLATDICAVSTLAECWASSSKMSHCFGHQKAVEALNC